MRRIPALCAIALAASTAAALVQDDAGTGADLPFQPADAPTLAPGSYTGALDPSAGDLGDRIRLLAPPDRMLVASARADAGGDPYLSAEDLTHRTVWTYTGEPLRAATATGGFYVTVEERSRTLAWSLDVALTGFPDVAVARVEAAPGAPAPWPPRAFTPWTLHVTVENRGEGPAQDAPLVVTARPTLGEAVLVTTIPVDVPAGGVQRYRFGWDPGAVVGEVEFVASVRDAFDPNPANDAAAVRAHAVAPVPGVSAPSP